MSKLLAAAQGGDLECVKELLQGTEEEKQQVLREAAAWGRLEVVRYVAGDWAGVDARDDETGASALIMAAQNGFTAVVRYLAGKCGADVNAQDKSGNTALLYAASRGYIVIARYLVGDCGTDVGVKNKYGYTALAWAIKNSHGEVIQYLIREGGADVNTETKDGQTSLMWAAEHGRIDLVRYLVHKRNASVNVENKRGYTALAWAIEKKHIEAVQFLVRDGGADVNTKTKHGQTSLMLAAAFGHTDFVRYLVEKCGAGVDVQNERGYTALAVAIESRHAEAIRYLIREGGADVNTKTKDGHTSLMCAAGHGRIDLVRYLLETCGASVNAKNMYGYTALAWSIENSHGEVIQYLIREGGADVNTETKDGQTSLMWAAEHGRIDLVRYLVQKRNASVSAENKYGYTALAWAIERKHIEAVQFLICEGGADVNTKTKRGQTSLMLAAEFGQTDFVRYLVEKCGAGVDVQDKHGHTALAIAIENRHAGVIQYLICEGGADVDTKTKDGQTSLMWAAECGRSDFVELLTRDFNADVDTRDNCSNTALIKATICGNFELVRYLVAQCGADVNVKNEKGYTALVFATKNNHMKIIKHFVRECGAHVDDQDNCGNTPLMKAAALGHVKAVRYFAGKCGADVNITNREGYGALAAAIENDHSTIIKYLSRKCSANVNVKTTNGGTTLMWAAERGHTDLVRFLVAECDADVNATDNKGYTALIKAARAGHIVVVRYLAGECGADVNGSDTTGDTALMWAAKRGHIEIVRYLTGECSANVDAVNHLGLTAFRLASNRGYQEIQRVITPYVSRIYRAQTTDNNTPKTANPAVKVSSLSIPPAEIELISFNPRGHFGGEFVARWLDAAAAVKLAIPEDLYNAFEKEVELWQKLRHPNIMKMYGACYASPQLRFFVCEYTSMGSLLEYVVALKANQSDIDLATRDKPTRTWKFLYEAALGLEYLHERGVIHGDLRCSNILIGNDGLAKLSNFALSGAVESVKSSDLGSMRWQSPEVLKGEKPRLASDVYSLGMCIVEAVTGKKPWLSKREKIVRSYKKGWTPESSGTGNIYEPKCPPGDAQSLVWRMCSNSPGKRVQLASVVYELERLAAEECSSHSQADLSGECTFHDYNNGILPELWSQVQTQIKQCTNTRYCRMFTELQILQYRVQRATCHPTILSRFHALLCEFYHVIKVTTEQARVVQLSSSRATTHSLRAFQWRINFLLGALGEPQDAAKKRQARWEIQRRDDIELFVSGVSNTYVLLKELQSTEERSAFLKLLQAEIEGAASKYSRDQIRVMQKAAKDIATSLGNGDLSKLTPEWFIPWYELTDGGWDCLGRGGFGSVYRARWLDSNVVVKQVGSDSRQGPNSYHSLSDFLSAAAGHTPATSAQKAEKMNVFRREVDIWFGFSHPHVVKLFGACHVGSPFFVCEYATNGTLVDYLRQHPDELWSKLQEAALGVQYLHARDVVHGDLKGNNIVVGSDMKAKVTDFGLSAITSGDCTAPISAAINWVAPECLNADGDNLQPTYASDIYSLGMCIIEALRVVEAVTHHHTNLTCLPWRNLAIAAIKHHVTKGKIPSRPSCSSNAWALVLQMCVFDPKKRIKISTVVEKLGKLAGAQTNQVRISQAVKMELIPKVVKSSRKVLSRVYAREEVRLALELSLYNSLWEDFKQKYEKLEVGQSVECREAFCALVVDARDRTLQLQNTQQDLVSIAHITMHCYTLHRRLSKFCDTYGLTSEYELSFDMAPITSRVDKLSLRLVRRQCARFFQNLKGKHGKKKAGASIFSFLSSTTASHSENSVENETEESGGVDASFERNILWLQGS